MIVPLPTNIDPSGQAQTFDGLAGRALLCGDTKLAREYHNKAARIYERQVLNLRKRSDKDALRYQAAMQYYLGGHYEKAQHLCRRIQADMLPTRFQGNYPNFLKQVHERAKPDYAQKTREQLIRHLQKLEYQQALDLLKEHQYVIENEADLASLRGYCCERLREYAVAAIFFADALQKSPEKPRGVLLYTAGPVGLIGKINVSEVWDYAQHLLNKLPHSLTYLAAAIVRFNQAVQIEGTARSRPLYEEQLQLFQEAEKRFSELPESVQRDLASRELMLRGFAEAVIACQNMGNVKEAQAILDRAIAFAPNNSFLRTLEHTVKGPHPDAEKASRTVIEFGNKITNKLAQSHSVFDQLAA
jgi:tetratricopeptide (TPR) repeat protein